MRCVPLLEQELLALPEHMSSPQPEMRKVLLKDEHHVLQYMKPIVDYDRYMLNPLALLIDIVYFI